ncbi:MAG TPA: hypothetical protein PK402_01635 [Tepidisphaeraceae bacterium]|nr:hypothetical protein [Tepidisphaeraceae bacterium]
MIDLVSAMPIRIFILAMTLLFVGCKPSGLTTTRSKSSDFKTIAERTKFLNEYVSFRRTYETLDFDIMYQNNNGGMVPGPSDWDVRLVATVPESELQAWIPAGVSSAPTADTQWMKTVPTTLDLSGVNEWYVDGTRVVGVDRTKRIIVYRVFSM